MNYKNIVLIGMPGSGKTSLGKLIAKDLNMNFVDTDEYIEEKERKTIKEIFRNGEDYFRLIEEFHISSLSSIFNSIISTGGGAILKEKNMENLNKNSIIVFINRPLKNIIKDMDINHRPLLKNKIDKIYDIYNERIELYKKYSDFEIINDDTIQNAKDEIIKIYKNWENK